VKGLVEIWLDNMDYVKKLFASPEVALWHNPDQFLSVFSQGQRLLQSDVLHVEMRPFYASFLSKSTEEKSRTKALKKVLAEGKPKEVLLEVLRGLGSLYPGRNLALVIDSPASFLRELDDTEPTDDEVDVAAMYEADYLRSFAELPVTELVLLAKEIEPLSLYQPIWNLAEHYGWRKGYKGTKPLINEKTDFTLLVNSSYKDLVSYWEAGMPVWGGLDSSFWTEEHDFQPSTNIKAYGTVPENANPEHVLAQLARLRMGGKGE
jgi:hypothetical protein